MNKSENNVFINGKWIPAKCEKYEPSLFERIEDIKLVLNRFLKSLITTTKYNN